jgi:hypothetical protein
MSKERRANDDGEREADLFEIRFHEGLAYKLGSSGLLFALIGVFFFVRSGFNLLSLALLGVGVSFVAKAMSHRGKAAKARARVREAMRDDEAANRGRSRRRARESERTPVDKRTDFLVAATHRIDGMSFGLLFVGPTSVHRFTEAMPPKAQARLFHELAAAKDAEEAEAIVLETVDGPDAGYVKSLERAAVQLHVDGDVLVLQHGQSESRIELPERDRERFRQALRMTPHPYRQS